ncbi:MAG: exodeoxyribonuclease VII large subunit [Erysipelotrichaceae bacterium]|nr:exodeoxyribonuclease VII large subunit [Erysipelotrichaceae bacterium]
MNNKIEYSSVSEVNRYLSYKFETDALLQKVFIEGEISNFKKSGSHYYFSLKDEFSEISAMFFYPANLSLSFKPSDGMKVQAVGKVQIYQKRGTYSIIVSNMQQVGIGLLYEKYLELKNKLEQEGLFLESHKMAIPEYPEVVGVITALTGEAINDIISTFNRRLPLAKIKLFPAIVQGSDAPKSLINALDLAYKDLSIDCLIIGRGGGSFEDLNCFNDEALARKLYEAPFPTISAVGHEGDYTICDFICSFRAPTPTGAAMKLTKEKKDVNELILNYSKRLTISIKNKLITGFNNWNALNSSYGLSKFDEIINVKEQQLIDLNNRLNLLSPETLAKKLDDKIYDLTSRLDGGINNYIDNKFLLLDSLNKRLRSELVIDYINNQYKDINNINKKMDLIINQRINDYDKIFNHLIEKCTILNPLNIIKKGYTIVYKDNDIVYNVKELEINDQINIKFSDGVATATINKIINNEEI